MRIFNWGVHQVEEHDRQWVLIPRSNAPTRIYIASVFVLYSVASFVLFHNISTPYKVANQTLTTINIPAIVWAVTAGIVAISQLVAFFVPSYTLYRVQAILTASWAAAYWVDLLYSVFITHVLLRTVGLVLWGWVVVVHLLFTRSRLTTMTSVPLPPIPGSLLAATDAEKVHRLQEYADTNSIAVPPRSKTTAFRRIRRKETPKLPQPPPPARADDVQEPDVG